MDIVSIRLEGVEDLDRFSRFLKEKRSSVLRDLIAEGKKMKAINLYKDKNISIGLAASFAGLSLSDFIDLLEQYNIELNLTLPDVKLALEGARKYI